MEKRDQTIQRRKIRGKEKKRAVREHYCMQASIVYDDPSEGRLQISHFILDYADVLPSVALGHPQQA